MRIVLPLAIISIFFAGRARSAERPLPLLEARDLSPYWPSEGGQGQPATVPAFHATDQAGHGVTEARFAGKITVVNFFYSQCGSICPAMMSSVQALQKKWDRRQDRPEILSFSVTPEHDSPAVLRSYARARHLNLKYWSLLTGSRAEIYHLGRDIFKADRSVGDAKEKSDFIHSSSLFVVDGQRHLRGIYDSESPAQIELLLKDIAALADEK